MVKGWEARSRDCDRDGGVVLRLIFFQLLPVFSQAQIP
jgi:hypothetical protein